MRQKTILSYFKASAKDWRDWRWQLKNRVTTLADLEKILGKSFLNKNTFKSITSVYPMAVTPYYLSLAETDDANDPVLHQCLPRREELSRAAEFVADPLGEDAHMPVPKLIHRYPDRCLAIVTEHCAAYCRHCNRKRFWSQKGSPELKTRLAEMTGYVARSPKIREVIISGGDPLTLDDGTLEKILSSFTAIDHVEVLRLGSRVPVVMPMRITRDLCRMLKRFRPLWFNTQFNHPSEITPDAARACNMLQEAGIPVSNQSVLLKGVNDSPAIMKDLVRGLQKISVRPYYLFHCEPVRGSAHFRTDPGKGVKLMESIWRECSGLCLPQYVLDAPRSAGKIPLSVLSGAMKNDLRRHQHYFDKFR